ncbi:hypothetical protein ACW0JT_18080 [Arthrobacter sp. SA17]
MKSHSIDTHDGKDVDDVAADVEDGNVDNRAAAEPLDEFGMGEDFTQPVSICGQERLVVNDRSQPACLDLHGFFAADR